MSIAQVSPNCKENPARDTEFDPKTLIAGAPMPREVSDLRPSPENDYIYGKVNLASADFLALVRDIQTAGIREPIVVTNDNFIVSGHRRFAAAKKLGLRSVPAATLPLARLTCDSSVYMGILRAHNHQRRKSVADEVREAIVDIDPEKCADELFEHRDQQRLRDMSQSGTVVDGVAVRVRSKISEKKQEMLEAVQRVIRENRKYWPLSVRQVHYRLINLSPRINTSARKRYKNTQACYKNLCDLMVRARTEGIIDWRVIADETRQSVNPTRHASLHHYVSDEFENYFLKGYRRDLLATQPCRIELLYEKLTVKSIVEPIADRYGVQYTALRGYAAAVSIKEVADRFIESGKDRLVVLLLADLDADGHGIGDSVVKSLRDDFHIPDWKFEVRRVGLTAEQVRSHNLASDMEAKISSSRFKSFSAKYPMLKNAEGRQAAYELEALPADTLAAIVEDAIVSTIDWSIADKEREQEKRDAVELAAVRATVKKIMGEHYSVPPASPGGEGA